MAWTWRHRRREWTRGQRQQREENKRRREPNLEDAHGLRSPFLQQSGPATRNVSFARGRVGRTAVEASGERRAPAAGGRGGSRAAGPRAHARCQAAKKRISFWVWRAKCRAAALLPGNGGMGDGAPAAGVFHDAIFSCCSRCFLETPGAAGANQAATAEAPTRISPFLTAGARRRGRPQKIGAFIHPKLAATWRKSASRSRSSPHSTVTCQPRRRRAPTPRRGCGECAPPRRRGVVGAERTATVAPSGIRRGQ